jgi:hypothetical protein
LSRADVSFVQKSRLTADVQGLVKILSEITIDHLGVEYPGCSDVPGFVREIIERVHSRHSQIYIHSGRSRPFPDLSPGRPLAALPFARPGIALGTGLKSEPDRTKALG